MVFAIRLRLLLEARLVLDTQLVFEQLQSDPLACIRDLACI